MQALFAQDAAAGAGWGAFGLAGLILAWLFFFGWPAKDKQIEKLIEDNDKRIDSLTEKYERKLELVAATFRQETQADKEEFKNALNVILAHCNDESRKLADAFRAEIQRIAGCDKEGGGG